MYFAEIFCSWLTVVYKNSRAENERLLFGLTQAEFLNFTYYFSFLNKPNLKIWGLCKQA